MNDLPQLELDVIGFLCPLPVLKLRKKIQNLSVGERIHVKTDDPAARIDISHFCTETGHKLIASHRFETHDSFVIEKSKTGA